MLHNFISFLTLLLIFRLHSNCLNNPLIFSSVSIICHINFSSIIFFLFQEKKSLYASEEELKNFVKQVLSWDIRSVSQRSRPHCSHIKTVTGDELLDESSDSDGHVDDKVSSSSQSYSKSTIYHLLVDGLDVSYTIGYHGDVVVDKVELASPSSRTRSN